MPAGRPFRAMAGAGVAILLWFGARMPAMQRDAAVLADLLAPPVVAQAARPHAPPPAPPPLVIMAQAAGVPAAKPPPAPEQAAVPAAAPPELAVAATETAPAPEPPPPSSPPPAPVAVTAGTPPDPAFVLADQAYAALRSGTRREAARLFDAALILQPDNRGWRHDRKALGRRLQVSAWALLRDSPLPQDNAPGRGLANFTASPVLGGGQMGVSAALMANPLSSRPLALVARANVAAGIHGIQQGAAQAAIGLRQTLLPGVTISAERLVAIGANAGSDWTLRLAAGGRRGRLEAYGEAGVLARGTVYGGGQAQAQLLHIGPVEIGAGAWGSVQTERTPGFPPVWRVDAGPVARLAWRGIRVEADWRQRVAGNAAPSSGPVVTVSAGF